MLHRFFSNMTRETPSSSSVQALFDFCSKSFSPSPTTPASSQAIHKLSSLLDKISPSDVGLKLKNQEDDRGHGLFGLNVFGRVNRWAQPITYIDLHECDSFTMCIFCFPTSGVIPLHDHPGMTVLSKILYGSLHVKAYDWVEPRRIVTSKGTKGLKLNSFQTLIRLAKLAVDKVFTAPCDTKILYPNTGGNLHCFTAITPCAVLDILTPSYSEDDGRKCTYYHDYPYSSFSTGMDGEIDDGKEEEYAWLAEIETPADLHMCNGRYMGPAIRI